MDVFRLDDWLIGEYEAFSRSFVQIRSDEIRWKVDAGYAARRFWPAPLLQINPHYKDSGSLKALVGDPGLHPSTSEIFRDFRATPSDPDQSLKLYRHQAEAIQIAMSDKSFVVTTGTGSGKSLCFFIPIVHAILKAKERDATPQTRAIVIYPMNALANSQMEELRKFLGQDGLVTFARYTGQESAEEREVIRRNAPDILLTNFMMLEMLMTRQSGLDHDVITNCRGLEFIVLDEPGAAGVVHRARRRWPWAAAAAVILLAVGTGWWMLSSQSGSVDADSLAELQARPGVAVLPFDNLSPDPEQSFFATGLTEELTARLAHFTNIRVIARNSASRFGGGSHDLREVSQALNARYIVEGSVRRDADRVRVTAQLIDGETGDHLWTSSYDESLSARAIFDIQDAIAASVASNIGGLGGAIRRSAAVPTAARPDDLDAYECTILHYQFWDTFDHEVHAKARDCLESAVERHPDFAPGWAELAYTYWTEHAYGVNPRPDSLSRAKAAAERAIKIDPQMAEGYGALSQTFRSMRLADEAVAAAERAFAINPNNVGIIGGAGCMLTFTGRLDRAEVFLDRARALDPFAPWWIPYCKSIWHVQSDDPEAALRMLDAYSGPEIWLLGFARIVALAEAGQVDEAKVARVRLLQNTPDFDAKVKPYLEKNFWALPDFQDRLLAALQAAGMPPP
jgi:TolB-like protein